MMGTMLPGVDAIFCLFLSVIVKFDHYGQMSVDSLVLCCFLLCNFVVFLLIPVVYYVK